ncbi:HAD hydrolase-like protein [Mycobacterium sp. AT1]|uniref:HAD hydrolase-like protein n=1 Tax=Mycobacterium sp. AT1 TaxID=1961706 RepID=UPI0018E9D6E0|nr:HAD hydrolase-like protein [Mycobacterium sp. AT1]
MSTVVFDLDGTLVDSAAGILATLQRAFDEVGVPWPDQELGTAILGPPLGQTLGPLVGAPAAEAIIGVYRRRYPEHGLTQSAPYPGVEELLRSVANVGARLAVATSKAEPFARSILDLHRWTELFEVVTGDTLDGQRPDKATVVGEALRRLGGATPDAVMVGDRRHDVQGSRAHGLRFLGAGWGYGTPGELQRAGVRDVYHTPHDLGVALTSPHTGTSRAGN